MTRSSLLLVLTVLLCNRATDAQVLAYDFECPDAVVGAPGSTVQVSGFVNLTASEAGVIAWGCGFETRSPDGLEFCIDASLEEFTPDDRRALLDSQDEPAPLLSFLPNSLLFGIQNAEDGCENLTGDVNHPQNRGRRGIIDAAQIGIGRSLMAHEDLRLFPFTINCVVPSDPLGKTLELEFVGHASTPPEDALNGPALPVFNEVSVLGVSTPVALPGVKTILVRPFDTCGRPVGCDVLYDLADPALAGPEWSVDALDALCANPESCSPSLTLQDLPAHTSLELSFDLYTLSDWQGGSEPHPRDRFRVSLWDGTALVDTTFSTDPVEQQLYPTPWPSGTLHDAGNGSFVTLTDPMQAGFGYAFRLPFPHADDTLTVQFDSINPSDTPGVFALDNVLVRSPDVMVRSFVLGDANVDGILDVVDPLAMLFHLFAGRDLPCLAAADFAVDSQLDIQDPVSLLRALFLLVGPTESLNCERRQPVESSLCCDHYRPCPLDDLQSSEVGTLADTGQEECFHVDGTATPCCATFNAGQDGFFFTGCSSENRFVDNADGTVTDTCTGLQWQQSGADVDSSGSFDPMIDRTNWTGALAYCASLGLAGHGDWRLPNVRELESLFAYGNTDSMVPSIDPVFHAEAALYCSSTSRASDPTFAYAVNFGAGASDPSIVRMDASKMAGGFFVRAVRDAPGGQTLSATGQSTCYTDTGAVIACGDASFPGQDGAHADACGPGGRFIANGNGTITDVCTGLQWQQTVEDPATWTEALSYCNALELAGRNDWRLPNVRELESIVDYATSSGILPALPGAFEGPADHYFSSTTGGTNPAHACTLNFALDPAAAGAGVVSMEAAKASAQHFVRAVRTAE
jgi:hypothetical protein